MSKKNKVQWETLTCPKCGHKFKKPSAFPLGKKERIIYEELLQDPFVEQHLKNLMPYFKANMQRDVVDRDILPLALFISGHKEYFLYALDKITKNPSFVEQGISPRYLLAILERKYNEYRKRLSTDPD